MPPLGSERLGAAMTPDSLGPRCDECEEASAAAWTCRECSCNLCDDCHGHHKRSKRTCQHTTGPIAQPGAGWSPEDVAPAAAPDAPPDAPPALIALGPYGTKLHLEMGEASLTPDGKKMRKAMLWRVRLTRARAPWLPPESPQPKSKSTFSKTMGSFKKAGSFKLLGGKKEEPALEVAGWLGIDMKNRADGHIVITGVNPKSPAAGAICILPGDLLVAVGQTTVRNLTPEGLAELARGPAGSEVELILGVQTIPGESFVSAHRLATGETVQVERVQRHAEGKEDKAKCKAVEISVENRPAQLTEVDMACMGTQSFDLLSLTKTINPSGSPQKIFTTPTATPEGSPTKQFACLSPQVVSSQQRASPASASSTPRSDTESTTSLGDRNLTPVQVRSLREARDFIERNSPIAMA